MQQLFIRETGFFLILLGHSFFSSPQGLKMTQQRWEEMHHPPGLKKLFLQSLQNHQAKFQEKLSEAVPYN